MQKLRQLIEHFETKWPLDSAEDWDRPGLMLGSINAEISKVLLSVDVTKEILEQAIELEADLVLSHHPMFLRGVTALPENSFQGELVALAIKNEIAIFAAHTNADFQETGVSNSLAKALGLNDLLPLDPASDQGVIGNIAETNLIEFVRHASRILPSVAAGLKVLGDPEKRISKVGLLGGAGDSFLQAALKSGVDLFITSDLRHHPASDFKAQAAIDGGPALMDISHWAAEWLWLEVAASELKRAFPTVEFVVSDINTDPWDFAVMQ